MTATTRRQAAVAPLRSWRADPGGGAGGLRKHTRTMAAGAVRLIEPDAEPYPAPAPCSRLRTSDPHALLSRHRQRMRQSAIRRGQPRVGASKKSEEDERELGAATHSSAAVAEDVSKVGTAAVPEHRRRNVTKPVASLPTDPIPQGRARGQYSKRGEYNPASMVVLTCPRFIYQSILEFR